MLRPLVKAGVLLLGQDCVSQRLSWQLTIGEDVGAGARVTAAYDGIEIACQGSVAICVQLVPVCAGAGGLAQRLTKSARKQDRKTAFVTSLNFLQRDAAKVNEGVSGALSARRWRPRTTSQTFGTENDYLALILLSIKRARCFVLPSLFV